MTAIYDKLLELINSANNPTVPFDLTTISFGLPVPDSTTTENTKIIVESVAGAGYMGSVSVYYNRILLSELGNKVWLFSDIQFTPDTIVSLLNESRNSFVLVEDLESITIPNMRVGDICVLAVTAQPNSINWIGQTNASLILGFPTVVNTLSVLMNTIFAAPNYLS